VNPRISSLFSVTLLAIAFSASAWSASAKPDAGNQEIQVTLFGQPCAMSGPFPKASLTNLHEISPEKLPPDLTLDQMKKVRAKTGDLKNMPMPIEQYRDHLRKPLSKKRSLRRKNRRTRKSRSTLSSRT
jgi:hypothetical protein